YGGGAWFSTFGYGEETITASDNSFQGNTANLDGGAISAWLTTFGT
ncbi:MAG: hypothetical protein GWN07_21815, partial [Actinobacteria bacterium]|nr:hypothetical protein [Actinomycetota bacterium]NIU68038.1 hypothetical protein [Actinomycetota bacterium]NIW29827.1 hypothetical protein [Actinomycetota bacterium]NIX22323.1 hypothetical protein [Actinomycetota bacterium]